MTTDQMYNEWLFQRPELNCPNNCLEHTAAMLFVGTMRGYWYGIFVAPVAADTTVIVVIAAAIIHITFTCTVTADLVKYWEPFPLCTL